MKKIFLTFIVIITVTSAFTQNANNKEANRISQNWIIENGADRQIAECKSITNDSGEIFLYVFKLYPKGFIIVSGEKKVSPVLAYSFNNNFTEDKKHPANEMWIRTYKENINYYREKNIETTTKVKNKWNYYNKESKLFIKSLKDKKSIVKTKGGNQYDENDILVKTHWNQGRHYNDSCPSNSLTGCVATAMAQILNYYEYPPKGIGSHSYLHSSYGTISVNFSTATYNWNNMPNNVNSTNPDVAQLMYHCGVAVNMDYSPTSSGAYVFDLMNAFPDHFDYTDVKRLFRTGLDDNNWIDTLMTEINNLRPVFFVGGGPNYEGYHAFICDGYNNNNFFHFNFGWGGLSNGFYYVNDIAPDGWDFTCHNEIVYNIKPREIILDLLVNVVKDQQDAGSFVSKIFAKDWHNPDANLSYSLLNYKDDGNYLIRNDSLFTNVVLNASIDDKDTIKIKVDNNAGKTIEKEFELIILSSDYVYIPDNNFTEALIEVGVDADGNSKISYTEAEATTKLTIDKQNISDLSGIEAFSNIEELFFYENNISDLNISDNVKLRILSCGNNQLSNIDVSDNVNLTGLYCNNNHLSNIDLSNNVNLERLSCNYNQLNSLDISNNKSINYLYCYWNQIDNIDLSENVDLEKFNCRYNQLKDLDVTNNIGLKGLYCDYNQLSNIDISNNINLEFIDISNNQIDSAVDLPNTSKLWEFYCNNNNFTFDVLEQMKNEVYSLRSTYNYDPRLDAFIPQNSVCLEEIIDIEYGSDYTLSVCVDAIGGSANHYQWHKDSILIGEDKSTLSIINASIEDEAIYTCDITNDTIVNLTINMRPINVKIVLTTPIPLISQNDKIKIYPNPSTGIFTINSPSTPLRAHNTCTLSGSIVERSRNAETTITITDITGRVVYHKGERFFTPDIALTINLSNEPKGIYFIRIQGKEDIFNSKIIIQ